MDQGLELKYEIECARNVMGVRKKETTAPNEVSQQGKTGLQEGVLRKTSLGPGRALASYSNTGGGCPLGFGWALT